MPSEYSKTHLIVKYRELADELGHPPSSREMTQATGYPARESYYEHYEGWPEVVKAAGYDPSNVGAAPGGGRGLKARDLSGHPAEEPPKNLDHALDLPLHATWPDGWTRRSTPESVQASTISFAANDRTYRLSLPAQIEIENVLVKLTPATPAVDKRGKFAWWIEIDQIGGDQRYWVRLDDLFESREDDLQNELEHE